jgi:hypothetical protein
MDGGVVPPCSELGQSGEHKVLYWMSGRARRNKERVVPLEYEEITRRAWDRRPAQNGERLRHLVDGGYLERVDYGETFSFRVLILCKENPLILPPGPPGRSEAMVASTDAAIASQALRVTSQDVVGTRNFNGPPSALNSTTLARDIFPQVVGGMTPLQANWPALAVNLKRWPEKYGIDFPLIYRMMEEFAQHPDWIRRSRNSPWKVFLTHRQDLVDRVLHQEQRSAMWSERPTPRSYSWA